MGRVEYPKSAANKKVQIGVMFCTAERTMGDTSANAARKHSWFATILHGLNRSPQSVTVTDVLQWIKLQSEV